MAHKILIIDDDTAILNRLNIYLESHGYDVVEYESGEAAIAFLEHKQAIDAQNAPYLIDRKTLTTKSLTAKTEPEVNNQLQTTQAPWKILIADDGKEVHAVSYCILQGIIFDGRSLEFHSAFSTHEVKEWINKHMAV